MTKRLNSRISRFAWGLIGIGLAILVAYVVLGGRAGAGGKPFMLKAAFRSDAEVVISSPVRVAGVYVGQVTGIEPLAPGSDAATLTMKINDDALPIHTDATAKIRTRLLLEGNYYIDLKPGTPSAPVLRSGQSIGVTQTSGPVQLDRLLTDLQADTRTDLRTVLQGFGGALGGKPGPAHPGEDPSTRGLTAGEAVNKSLEDFPQALLGTAQTTDALLGMQPDDLVNVIRGQADTLQGFAQNQAQLASLIGGFNTTLGSFAAEQGALQRSLQILPGVLGHANEAFTALDAAFPATRRFARELTPSLRELPATITAALPWIEQSRLSVRPSELGGLAVDLQPATASTAHTLTATNALLQQTDLASRCLLHSLLPSAETKVLDPPLSTGVPVYLEFFQSFTGVVSAGQNFDGNGAYLRAQPGGGDVPVASAPFFTQGRLRGNTTREPLGTRPAFPGAGNQPAYKPDVPCYTQTPADINGARKGKGP